MGLQGNLIVPDYEYNFTMKHVLRDNNILKQEKVMIGILLSIGKTLGNMRDVQIQAISYFLELTCTVLISIFLYIITSCVYRKTSTSKVIFQEYKEHYVRSNSNY